jgi:hypothetical protein
VSENEDLMPVPTGEFLVYRTEDGKTRVTCRVSEGTVWLTQAAMAGLFQTSPQNITLHIASVYEDGELEESATCKDYLQVQTEGSRLSGRDLLTHAGTVSHDAALAKAQIEFDKFRSIEDAKPQPIDIEFEKIIEKTKRLAPPGKRKQRGDAS